MWEVVPFLLMDFFIYWKFTFWTTSAYELRTTDIILVYIYSFFGTYLIEVTTSDMSGIQWYTSTEYVNVTRFRHENALNKLERERERERATVKVINAPRHHSSRVDSTSTCFVFELRPSYSLAISCYDCANCNTTISFASKNKTDVWMF